jgi:hypothetical protein
VVAACLACQANSCLRDKAILIGALVIAALSSGLIAYAMMFMK